jgi:hypothetical protein
MAAAEFTACSAMPGYVMLNSERFPAFPGWFQLLLQFLPQDHVVSPLESCTPGFACTPEKEIQWSQVRGARGPGYWFQHDDTPAHCTNVVLEYLDETFGNRWIGCGGPIILLYYIYI